MKTAIIVHGGAGNWNLESERLQEAVVACVEAAAAGQAILASGGPALDAVETAVRILEDSPVLNAGRGSRPTTEGNIEMDALIMDGRTLDVGAVAAVRRLRHPISLARRVMTDSPHALLVGPGAEAFADELGLPRCDLADLLVGEALERHLDQESLPAIDAQGNAGGSESLGDTVGAVAMDANGNLASATSTGGIDEQRPGRVGDSPMVGAGGYADNRTAAVSATGNGEALMKVVISKQVCDYVASGLSAQAACDTAIRLLAERVKGMGGLIAVDRQNQVGFAFNTTAMPHAYAIAEEEIVNGR
jgi:beta-aspartyl-peptidase (threonine type)